MHSYVIPYTCLFYMIVNSLTIKCYVVVQTVKKGEKSSFLTPRLVSKVIIIELIYSFKFDILRF